MPPQPPTLPGVDVPAPATPLVEAVLQPVQICRAQDGTIAATLFRQPDANHWLVSLPTPGGPLSHATGTGSTPRKAYRAAHRTLRLARYDTPRLLRDLALARAKHALSLDIYATISYENLDLQQQLAQAKHRLHEVAVSRPLPDDQRSFYDLAPGDAVVVTRDLPASGLKEGDTGTVTGVRRISGSNPATPLPPAPALLHPVPLVTAVFGPVDPALAPLPPAPAPVVSAPDLFGDMLRVQVDHARRLATATKKPELVKAQSIDELVQACITLLNDASIKLSTAHQRIDLLEKDLAAARAVPAPAAV